MSRKNVNFLAALVFVLSFTACTSTTEPRAGLVGVWLTPREQLSGTHSWETELTFTADGRFLRTNRNFGAYPGQRENDLSSYSHTTGTFSSDGDRLAVMPQRLVEWDRFYGANSPERVYDPYPYGSLFDDARYEIAGNDLILRYTTYPADAPVPTTMRLKWVATPD